MKYLNNASKEIRSLFHVLEKHFWEKMHWRQPRSWARIQLKFLFSAVEIVRLFEEGSCYKILAQEEP